MSGPKSVFSKEILIIENIAAEVDRIVQQLRNDMQHVLKRKGAVVGSSGGID